MMEYRNPVFTKDGRIDCEINHSALGWIPFTVDPDDAPELDTAIRTAGGVAAYVPPPVSGGDVDAERDRRIVFNFAFGGTAYDFDAVSKSRITGMATLAGFAIGAGAQAGDYFWHGGEDPFVWIAADNSPVAMDAQTCFAFGAAAARHESAHIFAARALRGMPVIPSDFAVDGYWP